MKMMKTRLRRSVAWVIASKNRYFTNPFFRSEFNIVILQIIFATLLVLLVAFYFNYIYRGISSAILSGIAASIANGESFTGGEILNTAEIVKNKNFLAFLVIACLVTLAFSYLIARVTLQPVRNAFSSQKRFISDIAHELRTPLSVIKTNSEVALIDGSLDPRLKKMIKSNIEELDRVSEIINNLLSFSTLLNPKHMDFTNVDLGEVVDSAVKKLRDLAYGKEIKLTVRKVKPYLVWGNSTALEQIVSNLLKNAINYTPNGGSVVVELSADFQKNILLTIIDTGIGIASKDLAHIFEPFFRAERSRNRQLGSSGLGLTIVSELVKLHSGRITIRSLVNKGTTVTVLFPLNKRVVEGSRAHDETSEVSIDFLQKENAAKTNP